MINLNQQVYKIYLDPSLITCMTRRTNDVLSFAILTRIATVQKISNEEVDGFIKITYYEYENVGEREFSSCVHL